METVCFMGVTISVAEHLHLLVRDSSVASILWVMDVAAAVLQDHGFIVRHKALVPQDEFIRQCCGTDGNIECCGTFA